MIESDDPDHLKLAKFARRVVEMRVRGDSINDIREFLIDNEGVDFSIPDLQKLIDYGLSLGRKRTMEELRDLEDARLDYLIKQAWYAFGKGETSVLGSILKAMKLRYELHGLEAPKALAMRVSRAQEEDIEQLRLSWSELKDQMALPASRSLALN